jgi:hypothetical protein
MDTVTAATPYERRSFAIAAIAVSVAAQVSLATTFPASFLHRGNPKSRHHFSSERSDIPVSRGLPFIAAVHLENNTRHAHALCAHDAARLSLTVLFCERL